MNIPSSYKYQAVSNMYGSVPDVLQTDLPMKYADSTFASAFHSFIGSLRNSNFLIEICFQTSPSYFDRIVLIHKQTDLSFDDFCVLES